jgi:hypothetical protein
MPGNFRLASSVALKKRETPLRLGAPDSSAFDIEATLPEGYQVVHAPKDFTVEHACFSLTRKVAVDGRKLTVRTSYSRRCTDVEVADYAGFRDAVQQAVHQFTDDLVFARTAPPAPRKGRP